MGLNKEFCLCGVHVHTATRVIAIVFLVLASIGLLRDTSVYISGNAPAYDLLLILASFAISSLINGSLLFGNVKQRSGFYWPFIISNIVGVIFTVVCAIAILIFGGALFGISESMPDYPDRQKFSLDSYYNQRDNGRQEYEQGKKFIEAFGAGISALMIFCSILLMAVSIFYGYLISIVIRSYRFLNEAAYPDSYNKLVEPKKEWA